MLRKWLSLKTNLSAVETLRTVREQAADYDPIDKLLQLQRDLLALEQRYDLPSPEFYRRYQAGEMGDDVEIVGWAGRYRVFSARFLEYEM